MQIRLDQLDAQLKRGLKPVYTLYCAGGDEPLLVQEAADAIRAAGRAAGHAERSVHTVAGARFDWSELLASSQALSLFADKRLIEIRIPGGKPGTEGSKALQRYCEALGDDLLTLVTLPRLDRATQQSAWFAALESAGVAVQVNPVERPALPAWIARRLHAQGQRVQGGEAGQRTLDFFADRVEGNLLAAHQEVQKLGLLHPAGELSFEQVEAAVLNVARYDPFKFCEAVLAGQASRALRMLDGLEAEGEAAVLVHWALAEDIRALKRVKQAVRAGRALEMALREQRVWGPKERLFRNLVPRLADHAADALVEAAQVCDGIVKGLRQPDWPLDPWGALRQLTLRVLDHSTQATAPLALVSATAR